MLKKIYDFFRIDFHQQRIFGLDIIRAVAIISVLFGHGGNLIPGEPDSFYYKSYSFLDGVFVFFVLSGFLIGEILIYTLENKPITAKTLLDFWKRRLLRTVPAYYIILTVLAILSILTVANFDVFEPIRYYFFIQNFDRSHPAFFAEAWTLSIEVWFYLLIPLFIFIFKGAFKFSDKASLLTTAFLFILAGFCVRWYRAETLLDLDGSAIDHMFRKQVITRIDSVTFGILGAFVFKYYNSIWLKYKNVCLVIGLSIFLYTKFPIFDHGDFFKLVLLYTLQSTSFLLILPFFSQIKTGKGLFFRVMTLLSYVSFSIYLINLNLVQIFIMDRINFGYFTGTSLLVVKYLVYLFLSITGGVLMYKYVELPFMNLRKKLN